MGRELVSERSAESSMTRSPGGRAIFDGATTSHRTPAATSARASPNPVGPASSATATGPGNATTHSTIAAVRGDNPQRRDLPDLAVDHATHD